MAAGAAIVALIATAAIVLFDGPGSGGRTRSPDAPGPAVTQSAVLAPSGPPSALPSTANATAAAFAEPATVSAVLSAARSAVPVVDSYDYRHLEDALAAGLRVSTGEFRNSYRQAMTGPVAAVAPGSKVAQTCVVRNAGIASLDAGGTRGAVVVFAQLSTTDTSTGSTPRLAEVALGLTMTKVAGRWLISAMSDLDSVVAPPAVPPGTPALVAAAQAGAQEMLELLSYRRASFDADFRRALTGMTPNLAAQQAGKKRQIHDSMSAGGYDLAGRLGAVAVERAEGGAVSLLVISQGDRVSAGTHTPATFALLEVGMTRPDGRWLVNRISAVGSA